MSASTGAPAVAAAGQQTPDLTFVDVSSEHHVGQWTRTFGSYWADYDRDGDDDFFLGRHQFAGWFMEKKRRLFSRRSHEELNKFMDRHGCGWGQATRDRRPDLYCAQGSDVGQGKGWNQLLVRTRDGFVDRAREFGVVDAYGRGRTVNWIDYDVDGDLDIFVGNARRAGAPNAMFRNDRGDFRRVVVGVERVMRTVSSSWADWDVDGDPDLLVLPGGEPPFAFENVDGQFQQRQLFDEFGGLWMSAVWGDYNGDGWPDLHLLKKERSLVLRNANGTFSRHHVFELNAGRSSSWFDVENDGDLDLFVVQGTRSDGPDDNTLNRRDLILVNELGAFTEFKDDSVWGPRAGDGDAVATLDFDRNGSEDVFVTNGNHDRSGPNVLLENRSSRFNWLGLDLEGSWKNPMAFGARIRVDPTDGVGYWRVQNDGLGGGAQSDVGYVHLGLGPAPSTQVRVEWPEGGADCISRAANRVVVLRRGSSPCP